MPLRDLGQRLKARPQQRRSTLVGRIRVNGRKVRIYALDPVACQLVERVARDHASVDLDTVQALYDAFGRACPDLSCEDILRMTPIEVGNLLGRAFASTPGHRIMRGQR